MDSNLFKETCRIIQENYEMLEDGNNPNKAMKNFENIINEFNKIIATKEIIKTNVYEEIVLFVKIYERVCDIQNWMEKYRDLKISIVKNLNFFPAEHQLISSKLNDLMNCESIVTRKLHEISVIIANSCILEDTKKK